MKLFSNKSILIITAYTKPYSFGGGTNALHLTHYLKNNEYNARIVSNKCKGKGIINKSTPSTIGVAWYNKNLFLKLISILWIAPIYFYLGMVHSIIYIVGAHNTGTPFVVFGAKLMQRKIIFRSTLIGEDDPKTLESTKTLRGLIAQCGLANCKLYHAINPAFENLLLESKYKKKKFVTISQGININRYNTLNRSSHKNQNEISIVSAGHIINRKGYKELFELLAKIEFSFKYYIATSMNFPKGFKKDQLLQEKKALITYGKFKLGDNLIIIENPERIEEVYKMADIIIHNSISEGTPNVVMEAMACGTVPVVKELPGFKDFLIFNGKNGFLYSNINEAGEILTKLYHDRKLINTVSRAASSFAKVNFSYNNTWREIQKALF